MPARRPTWWHDLHRRRCLRDTLVLRGKTMAENGKVYDCWHLEEVTEEEAQVKREEAAALLAGGPQARYEEGPAEYPPPARTPADLLAMPRCKLTGRLLDPEPAVKGETRDERLDREDRNFRARVADEERFQSTDRWK